MSGCRHMLFKAMPRLAGWHRRHSRRAGGGLLHQLHQDVFQFFAGRKLLGLFRSIGLDHGSMAAQKKGPRSRSRRSRRRAGADLASQPCAGEGGSSAAYILASFVVAFSGSFSSLVYQPLQAHSLCSLLRLEPFQA